MTAGTAELCLGQWSPCGHRCSLSLSQGLGSLAGVPQGQGAASSGGPAASWGPVCFLPQYAFPPAPSSLLVPRSLSHSVAQPFHEQLPLQTNTFLSQVRRPQTPALISHLTAEQLR